MNILNIKNNFNTQKVQAFKGNKQDNTPSANNNDDDNLNIFISPIYWQAARNVNLKIDSQTIKLNDGTTRTLNIDHGTVEDYLCTKDGKPDMELVNKFKEVYQSVLQGMIDLEDRRTQKSLEILLSKNNSGDAKKDKISKELATVLLNTSGAQRDEMENKAFATTIMIFELSKIREYEYDGFKDLEDKEDIVNQARHIGENFNSIAFPKISEAARDEDNVFDSEFAQRLCKVIGSSDFEVPIQETAEMLKSFIEKDPKNADKITDAIIKIDHSGFLICDCENFQNLVAQCFDRKSNEFSEYRLSILMNAIEAVQSCWSFGSIWQNLPSGMDEQWTKYSSDLIVQYFGKINNEHGGISPETYSLFDFFKAREEEVIENFLE